MTLSRPEGRKIVAAQWLFDSHSRDEPDDGRRQSLWGLPRRTPAIDHHSYEMNSGLWRWVTGERDNVLSISIKRLLGLGQP
jgi:hypothetical protein